MNRFFRALNKQRLAVFVALVLTGLNACTKKLEEVPRSSYAAESFFKTAAQAEMAVMGIYEVLGGTEGFGFYLSLQFAIDNDIAQVRGSNLAGDKRLIAHYSAQPNLKTIQDAWQNLYVGINRANVAIQKIPKMQAFSAGTEQERAELKRLLGEAQFLRGFLYFELVINWGDVPLLTTPTTASADLYPANTDRELIYDQIIADMTEAAAAIPWLSEIGSVDERISKGGVLGVLARVYLFRGGYSLRADGNRKRPDDYKAYYQKAAELTQTIITSGEHGLNSSYANVFKNYCSLKVDPYSSMFEVALFNPVGSSPHAGYIGTWNGPKTSAQSSYGRANSFYNVVPTFYYSYGAGDARKDVAVATFEIDENDQILPMTGKQRAKWAPGKWRRNWITGAPKDPNNTDVNWVLMRYADVLLMHAEAENEVHQRPTPSAYAAINEVRKRANLQPLPEGMNYADFFAAVKQERAWELCFEGWRKYDLIRWNILGEALKRTEEKTKQELRSNFPYVAGDYFEENKDELLPIPLHEMDENPNLQQNPKW